MFTLKDFIRKIHFIKWESLQSKRWVKKSLTSLWCHLCMIPKSPRCCFVISKYKIANNRTGKMSFNKECKVTKNEKNSNFDNQDKRLQLCWLNLLNVNDNDYNISNGQKMLFDLTTTKTWRILIVVAVFVDKTTCKREDVSCSKWLKISPTPHQNMLKTILIVYLFKMIGEIRTLFVNICLCTFSQYYWLKIHHSHRIVGMHSWTSDL